MKHIPCILCFQLYPAIDKNAIALVCDICQMEGEINLQKVLKNVNYKQVKDAIDKSGRNLKLTKDGEII